MSGDEESVAVPDVSAKATSTGTSFVDPPVSTPTADVSAKAPSTDSSFVDPPVSTATAASSSSVLISGSESEYVDDDDADDEDESESRDEDAINEMFDDEEKNHNDRTTSSNSEDDEDEADILRSPDGSWLQRAKLKKTVWKRSKKWNRRMQDMLPDIQPVNWTMKRYLTALCRKFGHTPRRAHTEFLEKPATQTKNTVDLKKKTHWTTKLDTARLLGVMFGTAEMRRKFVLSKQPLTRQQIDNRLEKTPSQLYWDEVAKDFSDENKVVPIAVNDSTVSAYLQVC